MWTRAEQILLTALIEVARDARRVEAFRNKRVQYHAQNAIAAIAEATELPVNAIVAELAGGDTAEVAASIIYQKALRETLGF